MDTAFRFHTRGKVYIFVDWANVYNWSRRTKWEIDLQRFFRYWKTYDEVSRLALFFGQDEHPKSKSFLEEAQKIGFEVHTKPVKYIEGYRKCDFDVEITTEFFLNLDKFETLILFSGDGDFAYPVKKLLEQKKRVFIVSSRGSLGREFYEMRQEKIHPILVDVMTLKDHIKKLSPEA